jgi:hypothetical protein
MLYKVVEKLWVEFFTCGIWNTFACGSRTPGAMDKWMFQADSAYRIGLKPTLHVVLIVVESGDRGE